MKTPKKSAIKFNSWCQYLKVNIRKKKNKILNFIFGFIHTNLQSFEKKKKNYMYN